MSSTWQEKFLRPMGKIWFLWAVGLLLNIITFLFIYFKIQPSGQTLALHYNVLVGVEWYGKGTNLFLIPLVGLLISLVNFTLLKTLKEGKNFFIPLLGFINLCIQFVLLAAVLFLAQVN